MNYKNRYIALNSVGCFLDKVTGITFAMLDIKDSYDKDTATHLNDCSDEWLSSLSKKDKQVVNDFFKFEYIK